MEPLNTFVLDGDDFEEANKARDVGYSRGGQWRGTYLPHFTEVMKRISAAMFADRVAFMETLQRHNEDFSLLLQHMAYYYQALFTDKSSCTSTSVAIIHPVNEFKSIHALRKNINTVAMLTHDALLCQFRRGVPQRDRQLRTLISYVLLSAPIKHTTLLGNSYTYYNTMYNSAFRRFRDYSMV